MLRVANMNLYLHLKWPFKNCFQTVFFTTSREERYSAYKMKNFGFHSKYDDEYEKVFIIFWTL